MYKSTEGTEQVEKGEKGNGEPSDLNKKLDKASLVDPDKINPKSPENLTASFVTEERLNHALDGFRQMFFDQIKSLLSPVSSAAESQTAQTKVETSQLGTPNQLNPYALEYHHSFPPTNLGKTTPPPTNQVPVTQPSNSNAQNFSTSTFSTPQNHGTSTSQANVLGLPASYQHRREWEFKFIPFQRRTPALWFSLLEQRFADRGIVEDGDKHWCVVMNLGPQLVEELSEVLLSFAPGSRYEQTKVALIKKFGETNEQKLERLFRGIEVGNLLPSEIYNKMKSLASDQLSPELLLRLWWKRLPNNIAIGIDSFVTAGNPIEAVNQADRLALLRRQAEPMNEISVVSHDESQISLVSQLAKRIEALEGRQSRAHQDANRSRNSSRNRSTSQNRRNLCFYHLKYKTKARKCQPPCDWTPQPPKQNNKPDDSKFCNNSQPKNANSVA